MDTELLDRIRRIVASYPDAPPDIESYDWMTVPRYWEAIHAPGASGADALIHPRHEDRHGGVRFRVGWHEQARVAAVWVL